MNYIYEIKRFYDRQLSERLSAGQISLWHALMEISNRNGWQEWFCAPTETLMIFSGLSRTGTLSALNRLVELGYIKKSNERYSMCTDYSTQQRQTNDSHLIYNKTKLNQTKLNKRKDVSDNGEAKLHGQDSISLPLGIKL